MLTFIVKGKYQNSVNYKKVVESIFCNPANWDLLFNHFEPQVFDHDWFAVPFVMTTCQVSLQQSGGIN